MALESALQAQSLWTRLRAFWTTVSTTVLGDIIATAVAIAGISVLFLACAIGFVWLTHAGQFVLRLAGAG